MKPFFNEQLTQPAGKIKTSSHRAEKLNPFGVELQTPCRIRCQEAPGARAQPFNEVVAFGSERQQGG